MRFYVERGNVMKDIERHAVNGMEMPVTEIDKTDIHRAVVQFCMTRLYLVFCSKD